MTQPTKAHCWVVKVVSEDGSELGPLDASISGDNCHRHTRPGGPKLEESSAWCLCLELCLRNLVLSSL